MMENTYYHLLVEGKPCVWIGSICPLTDDQLIKMAIGCRELTEEQAKIAVVEKIAEEAYAARLKPCNKP